MDKFNRRPSTPGEQMAEHGAKFDINQAVAALKALKQLRSNVGTVFQSLTDGVSRHYGQEGRESKFVSELQQQLVAVQTSVRETEELLSALEPSPLAMQVGNTGLLSQDATPDAVNLYESAVDAYAWMDNLNDYTGLATSLLAKNMLKRTVFPGLSAKRRRPQMSSQNVPPQVVDNIITGIDRSHPEMSIGISRPYGASTVLQITLGRIMKGIIILKGLMVEWVLIKGYNEDLLTEEGKLDMWGESRYKVFRKVTENFNAAMLHFYSPPHPELAIKSFLTWFNSYLTLLSHPCKKCGKHLHNLLPPTWRDLRTLEPYHEECKP